MVVAKHFFLFPQIVEAMPHTDMVQEFVSKLGDFYELVDAAGEKPTSNGDAFSRIPMDSLRSVAKGVGKQLEEKAKLQDSK